MHTRQRGITLIETIGALALGSILFVGMSQMMDASMEDLKGQQAAFYQSQVTDAARKYISANYDDLATKATATKIVAIPVSTLRDGKFLSTGFSDRNAYQQDTCVLVRQPDPAAYPGRFETLVVTSGGQKIGDKDLPIVALNAGQGSGYISYQEPTSAQGSSWSLSTGPYLNVPCGSAAQLTGNKNTDGGHLVSSIFSDGAGEIANDFLYRHEVKNHPELNQMNVPLLMADKALVSVDGPCGTTAGIAIDTISRSLLTCGSDGFWAEVTTWKAPVDTYGNLPTTGNRVGDVRMATNIGKAFTYDGSTWVALAEDQNGDLNVSRDVTVGRNLVANNNITAGQDLIANNNITGRDVTANGDLLVVGGATFKKHIHVLGDVNADGNVNAKDNVTAGRDVTAGDTVNTKDVQASNNVIAQSGIVGEIWAYSSAYQIGSHMTPDGQCNTFVGYDDNGLPIYSYPMSTVVTDQQGILMSCVRTGVGPTGYTFRYGNGLATR